LPVADLDRARLAEQLAGAVRQAGELALGKFRSPFKSWTKGNASPVSEVDIAVNDLLQERLAVDGIGWLSEETPDDSARMQTPRLWVVDPIDGTRAYIGGLPDWSISVALVENGRPTLGAVFAPVTGEMFLAVAGEGTTVNGAPVKASAGGLEGVRIAGPLHYLDRLQRLEARFVPLPKVHSLALRFARVAQGQIDAAFASGNSHDWDLAAADLLVHEAGGVLTTFTGQLLTYNRADPVHQPLVAAGRERHRKLIDLLRGQRIDAA
jgi:myo-inositol-1(or 4)-monophosphatase